MNNYFSGIQQKRDIHKLDNNLPNQYKNCSLHIALERADTNKDWESFKTILNMNRDILLQHLRMTEGIFPYNYESLKNEDRNELFAI